MLVFRCYDTLGSPSIQIERHTQCCGTGTCHKPDKREYQHTDTSEGMYNLTTAEALIQVIHTYVSALSDTKLSHALADHLAARRTTL